MNSYPSDVTVEVYVRPAQLMEPIDAKIETLRRLDAADRIDELSVHAWPERIALSERTPHDDAIEAFERMTEWAEARGASIRPPFDVRTTTSTFTDETRTLLRTPVMCLAVSVGGRLANVLPHSQGEEHYSVTDGIAALRTGELDLFTFTPRSTAPPDRCPACENVLMNVQGIGVCQECDRIELGTAATRAGSQRLRLAHRP